MKTKMLAAAAIAALAITPAAHAKPMKKAAAPTCAPVTQAAIEGQFAKFNNAWATKDAAKVTALFTGDAVLLATVSNKPRLNHAEINDYFVGFLKGSPVGTIDTSSVKLGCNMAARLGTWTVTFTDAATGAKNPVKARYSFIYAYDKGEWKIAHLHSSMMPEKIG